MQFPIIFSYLSTGDLLSFVSYEIINEVVKEFAGQVVRHTVDDKVHCHMTLIKTDDWLDEFIARNRGHFAPAFIGQRSMLYCSGITTKWRRGLRRDQGRDKFHTKYLTI